MCCTSAQTNSLVAKQLKNKTILKLVNRCTGFLSRCSPTATGVRAVLFSSSKSDVTVFQVCLSPFLATTVFFSAGAHRRVSTPDEGASGRLSSSVPWRPAPRCAGQRPKDLKKKIKNCSSFFVFFCKSFVRGSPDDILPALKYGVSCSLKEPIPSLQRGF